MDTRTQPMILDTTHSHILMHSSRTLDSRLVATLHNIRVLMRSKRLVSLGMRHRLNSKHTNSSNPLLNIPLAMGRSKAMHPHKAHLAVILLVPRDNTHHRPLAIDRLLGIQVATSLTNAWYLLGMY